MRSRRGTDSMDFPRNCGVLGVHFQSVLRGKGAVFVRFGTVPFQLQRVAPDSVQLAFDPPM